MMKIFLILILAFISYSHFAIAQKTTTIMNKNELTGVWQRDTKIVGNGLGQNFQFFSNGTFILNLGNDRDDARDILSIKGSYRLKVDTIYFTIKSEKKIVGGKVTVNPDGYGLGFNIFDVDSGKVKQIVKKTSVEQAPCFITVVSSTCIKIDNETYYKVSDNPKFQEN